MVYAPEISANTRQIEFLSQSINDREISVYQITTETDQQLLANTLGQRIHDMTGDMREVSVNALTVNSLIVLDQTNTFLLPAERATDLAPVLTQSLLSELGQIPMEGDEQPPNYIEASITSEDLSPTYAKLSDSQRVKMQELFAFSSDYDPDYLLYTQLSDNRLLISSFENPPCVVDFSKNPPQITQLRPNIPGIENEKLLGFYHEIADKNIFALVEANGGGGSHVVLLDKELKFRQFLKEKVNGDSAYIFTAEPRINCHGQDTVITSNGAGAWVWNMAGIVKTLSAGGHGLDVGNDCTVAVGPVGTVAISGEKKLVVVNPESNIVMGEIQGDFSSHSQSDDIESPLHPMGLNRVLYMNGHAQVIYISKSNNNQEIRLYELERKNKSLCLRKSISFQQIHQSRQLTDNSILLHAERKGTPLTASHIATAYHQTKNSFVSPETTHDIILYNPTLEQPQVLTLNGDSSLGEHDYMRDAVRYPDGSIAISTATKNDDGSFSEYRIHIFKFSEGVHEHVLSFKGIADRLSISPSKLSLINFGKKGAAEYSLQEMPGLLSIDFSQHDVSVDQYDSAKRTGFDPYRIISFDGGGVKGIIPIRLLQSIYEDKKHGLGKNGLVSLRDDIDHFAGTSIGGIIAGTLASRPRDNQDSNYRIDSLDGIAKIFSDHSSHIFPCLNRVTLGLFPVIVASKYSAKPLNDLFKLYFGDILLSRLSNQVSITAYNRTRGQLKLFTQSDAVYNVADNAYLRQAFIATSAAPYFLPQQEIDGESYVDGGMSINNPAVEAYMHAMRLGVPKDRITVVSLGTGEDIETGSERFINDGLYGWGRDLINVPMAQASEHSNRYIAQELGDRFFRIQVPLPRKIAMDDAGENNMTLMEDAVDRFMDNNKDVVRQYSATFRFES